MVSACVRISLVGRMLLTLVDSSWAGPACASASALTFAALSALRSLPLGLTDACGAFEKEEEEAEEAVLVAALHLLA